VSFIQKLYQSETKTPGRPLGREAHTPRMKREKREGGGEEEEEEEKGKGID
jgi:hypothetical protein